MALPKLVAASLGAAAIAGFAYVRYHEGSRWFSGGWQGAFTLVSIVAALAFGYGLYLRVSRWFSADWDRRPVQASRRLGQLLRYAVLQRKVFRDRLMGPAHFLLSASFFVLLAWFTISGVGPLSNVNFHPALDVMYLILGLAALVALYARLRPRAHRLNSRIQDFLIVTLLLAMSATFFIDRGLRIADTGDFLDPDPSSQPVRFAHVFFVTSFLALIPYTKLFHLFTAPLSAALAEHDRRDVLTFPFNLREQTEEEIARENKSFGLADINALPWWRVISLDACTECGRCQEVCPATNSEKPLSPMAIVLKLQNAGRQNGDAPLWSKISQEEVLACTTCGACVAECPVLIDPLGLIMDLRRNLAYEGRLDPGHARTLRRLTDSYNPWGQPWTTRMAWAQGAGAEEAKEGEEYDYLYWVGCAASFDSRAQSVARAVLDLLKKAGLRVAVLGSREKCTGDIARRAGDEGLFQELAIGNIREIRQVNARAVVTHCPHCFHTLKNEYPALGADFPVFHHTEVLRGLVEEGKLCGTRKMNQVVSYHDPCYLGRHNGRFDEPRGLLEALPEIRLAEMPRSREKSFCCGAGGAQMWLGTETGKRINLLRAEEALRLQPTTIATACPFCIVMLEEALQVRGVTDVKVKDVAELVAEALE